MFRHGTAFPIRLSRFTVQIDPGDVVLARVLLKPMSVGHSYVDTSIFYSILHILSVLGLPHTTVRSNPILHCASYVDTLHSHGCLLATPVGFIREVEHHLL